MNRIIVTTLLLATMLTLGSCRVLRSVFHRKAKKHADGNVLATDLPVNRRDTTKLFTGADTAKSTTLLTGLLPLWNHSTGYNTFSGKAKVRYDGKGDQQDFTAFIKMERDKKVWVSIIALGLVEALRAQITPDSIIAIDRIHHTVRALPAREAGKLLPIGFDFASLQWLLIGDVLQGTVLPEAVNTLTENQWQFVLNSGDTYQNAVFSKADSTLQSQLLQAGQDASFASIRYEDYSKDGGRKFSKHRIMQLRSKGETYNVDMEFTKVEFNGVIETPFSIPARYDKK